MKHTSISAIALAVSVGLVSHAATAAMTKNTTATNTTNAPVKVEEQKASLQSLLGKRLVLKGESAQEEQRYIIKFKETLTTDVISNASSSKSGSAETVQATKSIVKRPFEVQSARSEIQKVGERFVKSLENIA